MSSIVRSTDLRLWPAAVGFLLLGMAAASLFVRDVISIYYLALAGMLIFGATLVGRNRIYSFGAVTALAYLVYVFPDVLSYQEQHFAKFTTEEWRVVAARQLCCAHLTLSALFCFWYSKRETPTRFADPSRQLMNTWAVLSAIAGLIASLPLAQYGMLSLEIGRNAAHEATGGGHPIATGAVLYAISALCYALRWLTKGVMRIVIVVLLLWLLLCIFSGGTRFLLLFAASALIFNLWDPRQLDLRNIKRTLIPMAAVVLTVWMSSVVQQSFRAKGLSGWSDGSFFRGEGILNFLAVLDQRLPIMGTGWGQNHVNILLFWIPREFWPGKPRFLENAFLDYISHTGVSSGFSGAFGLPGYGVADFGYLGYILVIPFYFLLLSAFERFFLRSANSTSHFRIVGAFLPGISFFMIRQVSTPLFYVAEFIAFHALFWSASWLLAPRGSMRS